MTTEVLQDSLMLYLLQGMSLNDIIDISHFVGKCTFTKICNLFCFQKGSGKVVSVTEKENQKTTA